MTDAELDAIERHLRERWQIDVADALRLVAEVRRLREGLKPFAESIATVPLNWPPHCVLSWKQGVEQDGRYYAFAAYLHGDTVSNAPKVGDYYRAAELLGPPPAPCEVLGHLNPPAVIFPARSAPPGKATT